VPGRRAVLTGFAALALFGGVPAVRLAAAPASPAAVQPPAPAELDRLSLREVEIEAALPLARRGRVFRTVWLDAYFRRQAWCRPTGFDARDLPPAERARVDALVRYQASRPKAQLQQRERALRQRQRSARANCPRDVVAAGAGSSGPPRVAVGHGGGLTVFGCRAARWASAPKARSAAATAIKKPATKSSSRAAIAGRWP
jgi:hypothetical protein